MPYFISAKAGPQPDHAADDLAPSVDPIVVPEPPSERRIMVDRLAELQARRDSLTDDELEELKRLGRAL